LPPKLGAHDPLLIAGVRIAFNQLGDVGVRRLGGQATVGVHVTKRLVLESIEEF